MVGYKTYDNIRSNESSRAVSSNQMNSYQKLYCLHHSVQIITMFAVSPLIITIHRADYFITIQTECVQFGYHRFH